MADITGLPAETGSAADDAGGGGPDLPGVVRDYVRRCIPAEAAIPARVRITQEGSMLLGDRWRPFTAVEEYDVARVGFAWRARFRIAPLMWLAVVDEYRDGAGRLEGRLWGGPRVMRSTGHDTDVGQALRYLSELPWTPFSLVVNHELRWSAVGDRAAEVATAVGSSRVAVTLRFDESGDLVAASMPAKPRLVGKETVYTPWRGEVADYATLGGVRLPRRLRGLWDLPEGPCAYWEGCITSFEALPA